MKKVFMMILCVVCCSAYARIGETEEQCKSRYGMETGNTAGQKGNRGLSFEKGGIKISCEFFQNKCYQILFYVTGREPISKDSIQQFLVANSNNMKWNEVESNKKWLREDKQVTAEVKDNGRTMLIINLKDQENKKAIAAEKQKTDTKGF